MRDNINLIINASNTKIQLKDKIIRKKEEQKRTIRIWRFFFLMIKEIKSKGNSLFIYLLFFQTKETVQGNKKNNKSH